MSKPSKYTNDPALNHQVDLICAGEATKESAAAALGFKNVAILNTVLARTGLNKRVKGASSKEHLFKSGLSDSQTEALKKAVGAAAGLRRNSVTNKKTVWERDARGIVSYVYFCNLVKGVESRQAA